MLGIGNLNRFPQMSDFRNVSDALGNLLAGAELPYLLPALWGILQGEWTSLKQFPFHISGNSMEELVLPGKDFSIAGQFYMLT